MEASGIRDYISPRSLTATRRDRGRGDPMTAENRARMIVVTGVTGSQGGATARHLVRLGFRVRGLTRNPAGPAGRALASLGVEPFGGDMGDPASLRRAFEGA